jgi:peroxiredoxin
VRIKTLIFLALGLITGVALGLVIMYGFSGAGQSGTGLGLDVQNSLRAGDRAPDFSLVSLSGETVPLSQYEGRPLMINFWATWCAPCKVEMPLLQSRYEQHSDDLAILAIDYDEPKDVVQNFAGQLGLKFPILLDPGGKINDLFLVEGYPTSFFIDSSGVIQAVHVGQLTSQLLDQYLAVIGVQ